MEQLLSLLTDAILPSVVGPAVLLGAVDCGAMRVVTGRRFRTASLLMISATLGLQVLLMVAVLWLAMVWAHWNVTMVQRIGFRDLRPIPLPSLGSWVVVVVGTWMIAVVVFALHLAKKRLLASERETT
jgi:hypothetical protein